MKLLLDEQISPRVATALRRQGLDVVAVAERADLVGRDDADILVAAADERRTVVTENVRDFASLGARRLPSMRPHFGVVLLPRQARQRSRDDLGSMVRDLAAMLAAYPGDEELKELVVWLRVADDDLD